MAYDPLVKFTPNRVAGFLKILSMGGSVAYACRYAGVTRLMVEQWKREDPDFARQWDAAYEDGTDLYEDALREMARQGDMTAITFALRGRRPAVYNQRQVVIGGAEGADPIAVSVSQGGGPRVYVPATAPDPEDVAAQVVEGIVQVIAADESGDEEAA